MATAMLVISLISLGITLVGFGVKGATTVSTINSIKDVVNIDNVAAIKGFDEGWVGIASQALDMLIKFWNYEKMLITICAFIALIFYAFKLWFGTIELKKMFAESMLKICVVMVLTFVYPTVIEKTYTFATELGVEASGGEQTLTTTFGNLAVKLSTFWDGAAKYMVSALQEGGDKKDGKIVISDSIVKKLMATGLNETEVNQWITKQGFTTGDTSASGFWFWKNDQAIAEKKIKKELSDKETKQRMKQAVSVLRALTEVLSGVSENDIAEKKVTVVDLMTMGKENLEKIFYNPYIKDSKRLSVSTMVKTAVIIGEVTSSGALAPLETEGGTDEQELSIEEQVKGKKPRLVLRLVGILIKYFVYKLALIIGVIIVMCEYILTTIEYFIVSAISTLFIPLFFIDSTKQFATNILKTIFSYFAKLLVSTTMCFFVLEMWINMGVYACGLNLSSTVTILYYCFNIVLGVILAKSSGKIASAVISGNPSLGIGDIANEFRSMSHMAHTAGHAAQEMKRDLQNAAQKVPKAGGQVASFHANKRAAAAAAEDARSAAKHSIAQKAASGELASNMHSSDPAVRAQARKEVANQMRKAGDMAYKNTMKSSMSEYNKEAMFRALTGMDRSMFGHKGNGRLQIGQEFWVPEENRYKKATYEDCQERNKQLAEIAGDQTVDEFLKSMKPEGESNQRRQDHDYNWPQPGM